MLGGSMKFITPVPTHDQVLSAHRQMILSASGWRTVFARDGGEHSSSTDTAPAHQVIAVTAALAYSRYLRRKSPDTRVLITARDTRPTGEILEQLIAAALISEGWEVRSLGQAAVCEVIAWVMSDHTLQGGIYISASHNPLGHNGCKFLGPAGVIPGEESRELITEYTSLITHDDCIQQALGTLDKVPMDHLFQVLSRREAYKQQSLEVYREFTGHTAADSMCICGQDSLYSRIRSGVAEAPLSILIDYNGSARTTSIDESLLHSIDIPTAAMNHVPGVIAHGILPEGDNLNPCIKALEAAYSRDPSFQIGIVYDNDGDRGNIVYIDENTGKACRLEAQKLFALVVLSELAYTANGTQRPAVAVNCATSLLVDEVASRFNAQVFRGEVGEANVVNLAKELREQGYQVRVLGEGSNGGNITHPSTVRDPLNTLLSLIKLLTLRDEGSSKGLFSRWCEAAGIMDAPQKGFTLADIIGTLPAYTTTASSDPRALLEIYSADQEQLKTSYEECFSSSWQRDRQMLKNRFGFVSWREYNTEGTRSLEGVGSQFRSLSSGGLRIVFFDHQDTAKGSIWMRKSGTEPVFRVMADLKGHDPEGEALLLAWHRMIISKAEH